MSAPRTPIEKRMRARAQKIADEVSRSGQDIRNGVFSEIELLREGADEIELLRDALAHQPRGGKVA